jgi:hypothetical protein
MQTGQHCDSHIVDGDIAYLERLGRQSHWSFDTEVLRLGSLQQLSAHFLKRLDFAGSEGDADLVHFLFARRLVSNASSVRAGAGRIVLGLRRNPSRAFGTTFWQVDWVVDGR